MSLRSTLTLALLALLCGCYHSEQVDLVVHNATIHTMDEAGTTTQAMAVRDGRIVEMGPEREIMNRYQAENTVDAAKLHVYPGFIDGHCHFLGYGLNLQKLDLIGTKSWDEVLERLQRFAEAHPDREWLIGRGWDQNDWSTKDLPDNVRLNALFPDRPVLLQRVDGHAAVVNQAAMDRVGLDPDADIEGGLLERKDGRPTGLLLDNAVTVFQGIFDQADEATKRQALLDAQSDCLAAGLTMVCDAGLDTNTIDLIERMHAEGVLKIRVYAMVTDAPANLARYARTGPLLTDRLFVRSIKVYGDGALGSRGALLKEPYTDQPGHLGLQLASEAHFRDVAAWCREHGFQMNTHCIGDSANALLLSVYGNALAGATDLRWRIEHAQVVDPPDLGHFAEHGIIPSVQPTHATSDGPWAEERLGPERIAHAYAFETLRRQLGLIALGTDFPVEPIEPLGTFRSAVFRQDADGRPVDGYMPEEALSPGDALRGMTIWNAVATFTEEDLGTLEPGKWADFVILDHDLEQVDATALARTRVKDTYIAGEAVR